MYTRYITLDSKKRFSAISRFFATIQNKRRLNIVIFIIHAIFFPFLYITSIEISRLQSITQAFSYMTSTFNGWIFGYFCLVLLFVTFTVASSRPWITNLIFGVIFLLLGFSNYYRLQYRDSPVIPLDIAQLGEAMDMAETLDTPFTSIHWYIICFIVITTLILFPFRVPLRKGGKGILIRFGIAAILAGGTVLYTVLVFGNSTIMVNRGTAFYRSEQIKAEYEEFGFFSSFLYFLVTQSGSSGFDYGQTQLEDMKIQLNDASLNQSSKKADIVIIMAESFFDLEQIEGTHYSEPLMPNYERLAKEGIAGNTLSWVRDGATANMEYSALTGYSMSFIAPGVVPYVAMEEGTYPSLVSFLKENGYYTSAIHPYDRLFYNRNVAYSCMGFEEFIASDNFTEDDLMGSYISDAAFADKIIETYEKNKQADTPVFIHGVTMQSHVPHDISLYPEGYGVEASNDYSAVYDPVLSGYATGIRDADRMLGYLTDYFSSVDNEVLLLFFGDHQTQIRIVDSPDESDLFLLQPHIQEAAEDDLWNLMNVTPYLMWSNQQTSGEKGAVLGSYMLAASMLDEYDNLSPAWFTVLANSRGTLGGYVGGYFITPEGVQLETPLPEMEELVNNQYILQDNALNEGLPIFY